MSKRKPKIEEPKKPKAKKVIKEPIMGEEKPNCPECNVRDYKVTNRKSLGNGEFKFEVICNECSTMFYYIKTI